MEPGTLHPADPRPSSVTDLNRYAYAARNPTNFVDPTGTQGCDAAAIAAYGLYIGTDILESSAAYLAGETGVFSVFLGAPEIAAPAAAAFFAGLSLATVAFATYCLVRECTDVL